jgi:hypothetical protein
MQRRACLAPIVKQMRLLAVSSDDSRSILLWLAKRKKICVLSLRSFKSFVSLNVKYFSILHNLTPLNRLMFIEKSEIILLYIILLMFHYNTSYSHSKSQYGIKAKTNFFLLQNCEKRQHL